SDARAAAIWVCRSAPNAAASCASLNEAIPVTHCRCCGVSDLSTDALVAALCRAGRPPDDDDIAKTATTMTAASATIRTSTRARPCRAALGSDVETDISLLLWLDLTVTAGTIRSNGSAALRLASATTASENPS